MSDTINRLFELYIIQNNHYLLQFKGGHYRTVSDRAKPLRRYYLDAHLAGKMTVGTFGGKFFTKFITFDVDFRDQQTAKWVTYKIAAALDSVAVHNYAISFSGNKGYHVDVFFDKALPVDSCRRFFDSIIKLAGVDAISGGEVEYRPSGQQGVKLPLGTHQKSGQYCGFCEIESGLSIMDAEKSAAYLHGIQKTDHALILNAIIEPEEYDYEDRAVAEMEEVISRHKPLETYDQSESYTLARAADRYHTGMTGPGQRHKSFLLLARLFNHNGVDLQSATQAIAEWLTWQDPEFYNSTAEECEKDLRQCVDYIYARNYTLTMESRDLTVSFGEIDDIIHRCPQKNHKALAYAMLVHSKRWAGEDGSFYMTANQMSEASGVSLRTAKTITSQLEKLGVIEILKRDQKIRGTFLKRPNVYRMLLSAEPGGRVFKITDVSSISDCLRYFYDDGQLRNTLPRRQYESLIQAS